MNLKKDKWYSLTHKDSKGEHTHCVKVISNYGSGYLFWARRSPADEKDEFCFGVRKENILKVEPYKKL